MNDPHVVALIYAIEVRADVDYDGAKPITFDTQDFSGFLDSKHLRIDLKKHFSDHEEAIAFVNPFLRAWELEMDLSGRPGEIEFRYRTAEIKDRNPTPLPPGLHAISRSIEIPIEIRESLSRHISRATFTGPPYDLATTPDVEDMRHRLRMLSDDRTTLADAAYYCLTKVDLIAGNRKGAVATYGISMEVLTKLGDLSGNKGGREEVRKARAVTEYSPEERAWLGATIKAIIRRVAEVAFDPASAKTPLTMAELPRL